MVKPHCVEDGCLEIVDVHSVFDGMIAEIVGGAVGNAALHTRASHPDREGVLVVVASQPRRAVAFLVHRRTAELATPHDQGLVE